MKEQRRLGRAYRQIADDFSNKYPGEKKPSETSVYNHTHKVQVLVEEEMEPFEETAELPSGGPGETSVSSETKEEETEILNKFIEGKSLIDILKEKHHYGIVLRMKQIHEDEVQGDKKTRHINLLTSAGVYDPNAKDPIGGGIEALVDIAGGAEAELADFKDGTEIQKNEIFRGYRERVGQLKAENTELKKEVRGKDLAFAKRDREWVNYVANLKKSHVDEIKWWKGEVRNILSFKTKYEEAMNFVKSDGPLTEAYRKGQFNMLTRLYELDAGIFLEPTEKPFEMRQISGRKFRHQIEAKLEKTARVRDWKGFINVLVDLAQKIDPKAEKWLKRESAVVALARVSAHQDFYKQLADLGFSGSPEEFLGVLEGQKRKPQLISEVESLEAKKDELQREVETFEFERKCLEGIIPKLVELEQNARDKIKTYGKDVDAFIELRIKYNMSPREILSVYKKIVSRSSPNRY